MKTRSRPARRPAATGAAPSEVARDWGAVIGEAVTLALIVVVPIIINVRSENRNDIKDVTLGLGVAAALAVWLLFGLRRGALRWVASPLTPAVAAYTLWAAATLIFTHYRYAAVGELGRLAAHVGLFLLVLTYLRRIAQVRRLVVAACLSAVPVCIYGFVQAASKVPADPEGRVFSFLGNATFLASFLILIIPLAAAWVRRKGQSPAVSGLFALAIAMMAVCFYFTFSFGPVIGILLGLIAAAALWVIRGGRRTARWALLALCLALVLLVPAGLLVYRQMPPRQQARVQSILHFQDPYRGERQLHWRVALALFRQHPVTGVGYGVYSIEALAPMSAEWYGQSPARASQLLMPKYAHNELLQVLADTGTIGGVLFAALLALLYWSAGRIALRAQEAEWRRVGLALVVAVTAFLVQNQFGVTFHQTGAVTFFWLWMAVAAVGAAGVQGEPPLRTVQSRSSPAALAGAGAVAGGVLALLVWAVVPPMQASVQLRLARTLAGQGQWQAVTQVAEETVRLCPSSPMGNYLAGSGWSAQGDQQKATAYFEKSRRLLPGAGMVEYDAGYSYAQMGQFADAEKHYRRATELMPTAARAHASLGDTLVREGRFKEGEAELRQAAAFDLEKAPQYLAQANLAAQGKALAGQTTSAAANYLARVQELIAKKDFRGAAGVSAEWVKADPRAPDAYGNLGFCQLQLGEFSQAAESFRRVLALKPGDQQALYVLAVTYERLGQRADARKYLEQAVQADPESSFGQQAKALLDKLGAQP